MRGVYVLGLAFALTVLVACGGSETTAPVASPTTTTMAGPPPTDPAAVREDDYEYELDVIIDAEPDEGEPPLEVHFVTEADEEDGPLTYAWDFGDGSTGTGQNPVHVYQKIGEYTAVLTATDQKGNKGTDEIDIFVERE